MSDKSKKPDTFSTEQERILYQILRNTAATEEATKRISDNLDDHAHRYDSESKHRDRRLDKVESRVDRHDVIIGVGVFLTSTVCVTLIGWGIGIVG